MVVTMFFTDACTDVDDESLFQFASACWLLSLAVWTVCGRAVCDLLQIVQAVILRLVEIPISQSVRHSTDVPTFIVERRAASVISRVTIAIGEDLQPLHRFLWWKTLYEIAKWAHFASLWSIDAFFFAGAAVESTLMLNAKRKLLARVSLCKVRDDSRKHGSQGLSKSAVS